MSTRPQPFDGPQWDSWEIGGSGFHAYAHKSGVAISSDGWANFSQVDGEYPDAETARCVAEFIEAAKNGAAPDVAELVEALRDARDDLREWHTSYVQHSDGGIGTRPCNGCSTCELGPKLDELIAKYEPWPDFANMPEEEVRARLIAEGIDPDELDKRTRAKLAEIKAKYEAKP